MAIFRVIANALIVLIIVLLTVVAYRLLFHPLAKVPGPRLAAVTRWWLAFAVRTGRVNRITQVLHKKYGPVVRISPNEVSLSSQGAWRELYSTAAQTKYPKAPWYRICRVPMDIAPGGQLDFLTEMRMDVYKLQRRRVMPIYSMPSLEKHEHWIDKNLVTFVAATVKLDGSTVELDHWLHLFILDTLADITLSENMGFVQRGHDDDACRRSDDMWRVFSVLGLFPEIVEPLQTLKVPMGLIARLFGLEPPVPLSIFSFAGGKIGERLMVTKEKKADLLGDLMQMSEEKGDFPPGWLFCMGMTDFGAGHDTMMSALTSTVACICQRPKVQARVEDEIRAAMKDGILSDPPTYKEISHLEYLHLCIREAMRCYPIVGSSLARAVPAGGVVIDGYYFPEGTVVGINPYVQNSNKAIFGEDADDFRPERWLAAGAEEKREMERDLAVWGGPSRLCPGQHLAMFIMTKLLVSLFLKFEISVMLDDQVEMRAYFATHLAGVKAKFILRDA